MFRRFKSFLLRHFIKKNKMLNEKIIKSFYNAWESINTHPKLSPTNKINDSIWFFVTMVNPETNKVDINKRKNKKIQVCIEGGTCCIHKYMGKNNEYVFSISPTHDIDLDCGADTMEEVVILYVKKLEKKYGKYKINSHEYEKITCALEQAYYMIEIKKDFKRCKELDFGKPGWEKIIEYYYKIWKKDELKRIKRIKNFFKRVELDYE